MSDARQQARLWRLLQLLLPAWYRGAYGSELFRLHIDRAGEQAIGWVFWLRLGVDVLLTALHLRLDGVRTRAFRRATGVRSLLAAGGHSIAFALRSVLRARVFATGVVLTMVLGIGTNASLFTLVDRLFLSAPLHIERPDELKRVSTFGTSMFMDNEPGYFGGLTYRDYLDLSSVQGFAGLAGHSPRSLTFDRGAGSERIEVELASAGYFPLLGVRPVLGRFYGEADDRLAAPDPVIVLSWGFWQRRFGGRADVLGKRIEVGKGNYTVVGVAPRGFTGVDHARIDVWVPMFTAQWIEHGDSWTTGRGWYWIEAIVRLRDQATETATLAEATTRYRAGREADGESTAMRIVLNPLLESRGPDVSREARVVQLLAVVALLLLVMACANAANLFLARDLQRRRQIAVQSALGVGPGRLIAQLLAEALILGLVAGVISFGLAALVRPFLYRTLFPDSLLAIGSLLRSFAAILVLTLLTALPTTIGPALRARRVDTMEVLRSKAGSLRMFRIRRALLGMQAALSMILLVGAGLFVHSLQRARSVEPGIDLQAVGIRLELTPGSSDSRANVARAALERLRTQPGVVSAALISPLPYAMLYGLELDLPGSDSIVSGPAGPYSYVASGGYFSTVGISILRGRPLNDDDAGRVAVVSSSFANSVWPGQEPLGKCLIVVGSGDEPPCTAVVGVASDVLVGLTSDRVMRSAYFPLRHPDAASGITADQLVVRLRADPIAQLGMLRQVVTATTTEIRYVDAATFGQLTEHELRAWQLGAIVFAVFGVLALVVATAGLYSVLAFEMAQRRFEIGLRSALGATARQLARGLLRGVAGVTVCGMAIGLVAALALAHRAESLLFRVEATDPFAYTGAVCLLLGCAVSALVLPVRRATRVDPGAALQAE